MVIKVISSVLFHIKGRKIESVVHHDMLKLCEDRVVPMWAKRVRHKILDLDETLPYEEDEEEDSVGIVLLFDNQPVTAPDPVISTSTQAPSKIAEQQIEAARDY